MGGRVGGFSAKKWEKLSDPERIEYCRTSAREAAAFGKLARPEMRQFYRDLAAQWRMLANEIESRSGLKGKD